MLSFDLLGVKNCAKVNTHCSSYLGSSGAKANVNNVITAQLLINHIVVPGVVVPKLVVLVVAKLTYPAEQTHIFRARKWIILEPTSNSCSDSL